MQTLQPNRTFRLTDASPWAARLLLLCQSTDLTAQSVNAQNGGTESLSLGMTFTAFLVMLGPLKLVGPFARLTSDLPEGEARKVAAKAIGFACMGGLVAAVTGQNTLASWGISLPVLHLTAGIVLLLVALRTVMAQYEPVPDLTAAAPARNLALMPLAFPTILTPHGIAIFILLLALTRDAVREVAIIALFLGVMALNWVVMAFARPIVRRSGVFLAIMGSVLGVLQVALGVQIMLTALRSLYTQAK